MSLAPALDALTALGHPEHLDHLRQAVDPAWIEEALLATGTATLRHRRLPAEQVVWLVLGMALFRDRAITEICAKLDLALPARRGPTAAPSAVSQARTRPGASPLEYLFERTAEHWAPASAEAHQWRGLALYSIDGTSLRVPDVAPNRAHFGSPASGRGSSGYPLVRLVALMALRSHLIAAARFGPYGVDERTYARELVDLLPERSLVVLDRNFVSAPLLIPLHAAHESGDRGHERHWLVRAKRNLRGEVLAELGEGDVLLALHVTAAARRQDPTLPRTWRVRAITYQRPGHPPQRLLTSLLDAVRYPAAEVVGLYHRATRCPERWVVEMGYDEVKTELLARHEALRSKSPEGVGQELWGALLVYNLVRLEMERVAAEAEVEPVRISFVAALRLIRDEWLWCAVANPGSIPRHLRRLRADLKLFVLPERRSGRVYPRAVKLKMSGYPRARPRGPTTPP